MKMVGKGVRKVLICLRVVRRPLRRGHLHRPEGSKESSHVHVLGKSLSGKDEQRRLCCQAGVSKKQNGRRCYQGIRC